MTGLAYIKSYIYVKEDIVSIEVNGMSTIIV